MMSHSLDLVIIRNLAADPHQERQLLRQVYAGVLGEPIFYERVGAVHLDAVAKAAQKIDRAFGIRISRVLRNGLTMRAAPIVLLVLAAGHGHLPLADAPTGQAVATRAALEAGTVAGSLGGELRLDLAVLEAASLVGVVRVLAKAGMDGTSTGVAVHAGLAGRASHATKGVHVAPIHLASRMRGTAGTRIQRGGLTPRLTRQRPVGFAGVTRMPEAYGYRPAIPRDLTFADGANSRSWLRVSGTRRSRRSPSGLSRSRPGRSIRPVATIAVAVRWPGARRGNGSRTRREIS